MIQWFDDGLVDNDDDIDYSKMYKQREEDYKKTIMERNKEIENLKEQIEGLKVTICALKNSTK